MSVYHSSLRRLLYSCLGLNFIVVYLSVENGGVVESSILIVDNTIKKSGNDSLRIEISNGTFRYSGISHVYESMENWSECDYLSFRWFGGNTGNPSWTEVKELLMFTEGKSGMHASMGEQSRKLVEDKLSWDNIAKQYMEIYETVLEKRAHMFSP